MHWHVIVQASGKCRFQVHVQMYFLHFFVVNVGQEFMKRDTANKVNTKKAKFDINVNLEAGYF